MIIHHIIDSLKQEFLSGSLYDDRIRDLAFIVNGLDDFTPDYRPLLINRDYLPFKMRPAYDSMCAGYGKMMKRITLPSKDGFTSDDIMAIHNAVLNDNPQLYYLDSRVSFIPGSCPVVIPNYTVDGNLKKETDSLLESISKKIFISETDGCFRRERMVSDYIHENVRYGSNKGEHRSHTILGSLLDGVAVCDGISRGVSFLLNRLGVPCSTISGVLDGVGHSWNVVEICGERYHLDVTNNYGVIPDCYYNSTDDVISKTHTLPFKCGCSDSSRLFDNRYVSIKRSEVLLFLRGFFNSGDSRVLFSVSDGLSKSSFEVELEKAMTMAGRTIHCSYSCSETIGLFSLSMDY